MVVVVWGGGGAGGVQWISCRVLDLRPKGRRIEPHRRHCIVSLSKAHLSLLSTGSTQEDWKIVDWDVKNQIQQNQTKLSLGFPTK